MVFMVRLPFVFVTHDFFPKVSLHVSVSLCIYVKHIYLYINMHMHVNIKAVCLQVRFAL